MIGATLAHYRIVEKLGEGGMGVVYKARDTQLDRFVAIKILPPEKLANPDRRLRFIQEAKSASALNHPNIITVHDIDSSDGVDFIAMEYVEGKTLERLIGHRGLPLSEATRYAIELADALAAAHDAGIVHRDLKPSNIMVTEKGHVKVLDFGLAKLADSLAGADPPNEYTATQSLTAARCPQTEDGMIVGTVAFMSPEQASGKKVDRRSDIFSFGSVLYEMVTGKRAFRGDKVTLLAAILQQDPQPVCQLVTALPPELDRIIARCLRKDPERRFQHMDDVRVALQDLKDESESGRLLQPPERARARTRAAPRLIATAIVVIAATATATWWLSRPQPAQSIAGIARLTSDSGLTWEPALSPDGKLVAYSSDRGEPLGPERNLDIWVQQLAGGEPIRLTHDAADDREPAFSPDSSRIVFRSDREGGGIYIVPALGGEERLVAPNGQHPHFSPDGQWIVYWVGNRYTGDPAAPGSAQAYIVPSTGGLPHRIHMEFSVIRDPLWAPDGKRLLFWGKLDAKAAGPDSTDWWVAPVESGTAVRTGAVAAFRGEKLPGYITPAAWLPDGRVVFAARHGDSSDLWQLSIASGTWRAGNIPVRITAGTGTSDQPSIAVFRDAAGRSVTRVAFSALTRDIQIWSVPFDANKGKVRGELHRLTHGPASAEFGSLSADGKRLVFSRSRGDDADIWIKDLPSGRETDLTPTPARQFHPRIAPDGSKVSYSETQGNGDSIYVMSIRSAADGSFRHTVPEKLCDGCRYAWQWSWDAKYVLFDAGPGGRPYIKVANVASGETAILLRHPQYNLYQANSSPDGRWVAFLAHTDALHGRLFIAPFRPAPAAASEGAPSDWIPVTDGKVWDDKPRWSPDGNSLYFISNRDGFQCFWGQHLDPATKRPIEPPFAIYHLHSASLSMMNVGLARLEPTMASDLMAFNLAETTGNIWTATIEPPK